MTLGLYSLGMLMTWLLFMGLRWLGYGLDRPLVVDGIFAVIWWFTLPMAILAFCEAKLSNIEMEGKDE